MEDYCVAVAVSLDGEYESTPSLDALSRIVRADLRLVNGLIVDRMQSPVPLIPQPGLRRL